MLMGIRDGEGGDMMREGMYILISRLKVIPTKKAFVWVEQLIE